MRRPAPPRVLALCAALLALAAAPGCPVEEVIEHGLLRDGSGVNADLPDGGMTAPPFEELDPVADGALGGPAAEVRIEDLWSEPLTFAMRDYPVTVAIAAVHASKIMARYGIPATPNTMLAVGLQWSRLGCFDDPAAYPDGCFGLRAETNWTELQRVYPDVYGAISFEAARQNPELAIVASAYLKAFEQRMLARYFSGSPLGFYQGRADGDVEQMWTLHAMGLRSAFWEPLAAIEMNCAQARVETCVDDDVARAHATQIVELDALMSASPAFDARLGEGIMWRYWMRIAALYPEANTGILERELEVHHRSRAPVTFQDDIDFLLERMIAVLNDPPSSSAIDARLCELSYLSGDDCLVE